MSQAEKIKEITDRLEAGIQELFQSNRLNDYLKTMAKFHRYSFNNTILIYLQRPDATHVAGYQTWQREFNRYVKRGESGIKILAPLPYKVEKEVKSIDPITQKKVVETVECTILAYKPVTVFDISQTDGEPLPKLIDELSGEVKDYDLFFKSISQITPFPIGFEIINGETPKGFCNYEERRIVIKEGMSQVQTIKTVIHEVTHAWLHDVYNQQEKEIPPDQQKDRHTREVEAESVAYTVCQHYGIDTSDYSFGYIAAWSSGRDIKELKSSLEIIRRTASVIITSIDEQVKQLSNIQVAATQEEDELER